MQDRTTQDNRLLRLSTPLGGDALLAECVRGEEGLSQGYRYDIEALSEDAGLSLKSLIGQPALLELATAGAPLRPFHGHVTAAELSGANGGFARYRLRLEPWTAFLAHGRDSRVFQDMTVFDILDAVFARWQGQGKLAPAWRFDSVARDSYPKRSLSTQYQESDWAYAQRLMGEEGLFYYFEHSGDAGSPGLGSHTLVVADHNGVFQPNAQDTVDFTQPGAVMRADSMDRWRCELRRQTDAVELLSWDYRSLGTRTATAAAAAPAGGKPAHPLTSRDAPGVYAYASREHGQRIAERQLQALAASREVYTGAGTVRTLAPGTTFTLRGQAATELAAHDDERAFLVLRVRHLMHNNLSAPLQTAVAARLGLGAVAVAARAELGDSLHAVGGTIAERPLYRNRVDAIRASLPYRSAARDGHGRLLHPRPTVDGQQTAIVVGPAGAPVFTDRDHRIKVQFHWQRGDASHSRLGHPAPGGHSGAPGDEQAGTWVRVATPMAPVAGQNWGSSALPRVGQEVLVDFLEGDIDRPVVIGTLYNGQGTPDAQHNQIAQGAAAATGNAGAWFPGTAGGHAHPAALSGFKSQAMNSSQQGAGAYSQLVFDDSAGQPRIGLQRHAAPHEGTAELNLGQLRHQSDNQRLAPTGFGAELKTAHALAVRAGQGLLLSGDARRGAAGAQLDSREARQQVELSAQLQIKLADTAQKQQAGLKKNGEDEAAPDALPAIAAMARSAEVLAATAAGAGAAEGGQGQVAAYSAAQLQLSSPAGIAAATPADAILGAAASSALTAGQDINLAAQGNALHAVGMGIALFTYGKAGAADKPNQETGIRLHAASGKFSSQSQAGPTRLTADKAVTVASTTKEVTVAARQHVLLTAQGAYIKLEGGNIEIHGPGKMEFKASMKELAGPQDGSAGLPVLPKAQDLYNEAFVVKDEKTGAVMAHVPYRIESASGAVVEGVTDALGRTQRLFTEKKEQIKLFLKDPG